MSDELYYTSVPRGLKPGSSGFTTVAATVTLGPAWIERLEMLSGYQPLFPLGHPSESENPPAYSHLRLTIAGRTRSVVSRIGYASGDYTGRSNKFAHHIVLDDAERGPAGPAWLLRQRITETQWRGGEPRLLTAGRTIPRAAIPVAPASTWEAVTGDAEWAHVLADTALGGAGKVTYLIYTQGTDVLALIDEALRLLPESQRWQVTFNTYVTERMAGITCDWRCVVADSPAMGLVRGMVIDLTRPLGRAPTSRRADVESIKAPPILDAAARSVEIPLLSEEPMTVAGDTIQPPVFYADQPAATSRRRRRRVPVMLLVVTGLIACLVLGILFSRQAAKAERETRELASAKRRLTAMALRAGIDRLGMSLPERDTIASARNILDQRVLAYKRHTASKMLARASAAFTSGVAALRNVTANDHTMRGPGEAPPEDNENSATRPNSPSGAPTTEPATQPATAPSSQPTTEPATQPATAPSTQPTTEPTMQPATIEWNVASPGTNPDVSEKLLDEIGDDAKLVLSGVVPDGWSTNDAPSFPGRKVIQIRQRKPAIWVQVLRKRNKWYLQSNFPVCWPRTENDRDTFRKITSLKFEVTDRSGKKLVVVPRVD